MTDPRTIEGARGRYLVLGHIASGAMGRVYLARHYAKDGSLLGEVAIKRIRPDLVDDEHIRKMFSDEGRLSRLLVHPNIVRTHEMGSLDDGPFLAMELVSGVTLQGLAQRLLAQGRTLPVPLVIEVVRQVLEGLAYAHARTDASGEPLGIVHRDVSPQNLMVSFCGGVKLFDFGVGLAKGRTHQTNPGFVKGRLAYMSPEQVKNGQVDARSDLFSVGVLAYEALVLVHPFYGKTDATLMRAVMEQPAPDPRSVDQGFPPELAEILLRALEKDPDRRFQSAAAFAAALDRFVSGWRFPPGPELAELVREAFAGRVALEGRARADRDDELLVRAMRDDYEGHPASEGSAPRQGQGEQLFADLPTADVELAEPEEGPFPRFSHAAELWRLLDAMPTPMFATRVADGQVVYVNQPILDLFGARVGEPLFSESYYVNPADRSRLLARVERQSTERGFVLEMKRSDGRRFWASVAARLIEWDGDRLLIGTLSDISDQVEVESRLARRLVHQRRLAQAAAALLRTRDVDPADTGLIEALEHLRAGTEADRVVLMQVRHHPARGRGLVRSHAAGLELGEPRWIELEDIPRWRALFERGEVLRGFVEAFPESERDLLERLGVGTILAGPISRKGAWLGVIALEGVEPTRKWSDEDVTSLETLAGVLGGELTRRLERTRSGGDAPWVTAALLSAGSRLQEKLSVMKAAAKADMAEPEARRMVLGPLDGFAATLGAPEAPREAADLARSFDSQEGFHSISIEGPRPMLVPGPVGAAVAEVVDELRGRGVSLALRPGPAGGYRLTIAIPSGGTAIWAALGGDLGALARPGSRVGGLVGLRERLGIPLRLHENEGGLRIEVDLPASVPELE